MIKLSASVSKKVPVPDVEFSSQSYSAGMEVEVSSGTEPEEIQKKLKVLYALLERSIDAQLAAGQSEAPQPLPDQPSRRGINGRETRPNGHRTGNGTRNARTATEAQVRAIQAIAGDRGYSEQGLADLLSSRFGARTVEALSIGDASHLIDLLKNNGKE